MGGMCTSGEKGGQRGGRDKKEGGRKEKELVLVLSSTVREVNERTSRKVEEGAGGRKCLGAGVGRWSGRRVRGGGKGWVREGKLLVETGGEEKVGHRSFLMRVRGTKDDQIQ